MSYIVATERDPQETQDSALDKRYKETVFPLFSNSFFKLLRHKECNKCLFFSSDPDRGHRVRHDSPDLSPKRARHDSPDLSPKRARHDSPELSPQRARHDSPDLSPQTHGAENISRQHDSLSPSPSRKSHKSSPSRTQRPHDKGTEIYPQIRNNIYTELSGSK